MIVGVGCDIVNISRIEALIEKGNFLSRCFSERECEYFKAKHNKAESVAAGFAAKEAVAKALGTGISGFSFKDIEILHKDNGCPYVKLSGGAEKIASDKSAVLFISMSHSDDMAIAYAVCESTHE